MAKKQPAIIEALAMIQQVKALSQIVARNPDGQDARWQLLQDWLASNPQYRKLVERCLDLSPSNALQTICAEMGVDLKLLQAFDRNGSVTLMAVETIETIQNLYRERAGIAQGELSK